MGYSSMECVSVPFDLSRIPIFCPYGAITEVKYIGINPDVRGASMDACMDFESNSICNSKIRPEYKQSIKTFCDGANDLRCNFDYSETEMSAEPLPAECTSQNARFYVQYTCE